MAEAGNDFRTVPPMPPAGIGVSPAAPVVEAALPAEASPEFSPLPPADADEPDAAARRRAQVDLLVDRCLDGAMGLCCRALDPDGLDPSGRDEARRLVMRALADCARKRLSADDESVRAVMRRTSELGMDALVAHPGSAVPPNGVSLEKILPSGIPASGVAPHGRLAYAVLQDAVAAARATDRQVAFTVLAASIPTGDAAILLGIEVADVDSALQRIGRRLGEGHSGSNIGERVA